MENMFGLEKVLFDNIINWQFSKPNFSKPRIIASANEIEEKLKPKEMHMDEYLKLTREALTTQDVSKKKFSYSIQQGGSLSQIIVHDSLIKWIQWR
jgi:hypothetical protein